MTIVKTSELIGKSLDWAVAMIEKPNICLDHFISMHGNYKYDKGTYEYSTDWAQGGPIIERECIELGLPRERMAKLFFRSNPSYEAGQTPLIAAMRCYVASKLGDEVDIPEELMK